MSGEACDCGAATDGPWADKHYSDCASLKPAEPREALARWMIAHSFATGHGDTFEALLDELSWQVAELRNHDTRPLTRALKKFAPDIAEMISSRWIKENKEADEALQRFTRVMAGETP
jgi:hypothetical protein